MPYITEEQYALLAPYLPKQRGNVKISNLKVINALLHMLVNGYTWRAMPKEFGPWHSIYMRLYRWTESGVLAQLFIAMQQLRIIQIKVECLSLDSTSVKVHAHGTGAPKKTAHNPLGSRAAAEPPKFIWLPQMNAPL